MARSPSPFSRSASALGSLAQGAGARLRSGAGPGGMPVSSRLATWVGIVSAVTGGFLGLRTYQKDVDKQVDESVAQTFLMVADYNAPDFAPARQRTLSYVEARRFCDARLIADGLTDADFIQVLDFFDLANACVEARLCDRPTAERFFTPYANYQWPVLSRVVERMRARPQTLRADSAFGEGMKAFALTPTPAPPCDGNF